MAKTSSSYLWLKTLWFFGIVTRTHCEKFVVRCAGTSQLIVLSADDLGARTEGRHQYWLAIKGSRFANVLKQGPQNFQERQIRTGAKN
jgi:hypothetical protein